MTELDPAISNYLRARALKSRDYHIQAASPIERRLDDDMAGTERTRRITGSLALRLTAAARRITGTDEADVTHR
ncbi:MAG TPA: hypothetical protein VF597_03855 [Candidatus Saccharimonadales bacterium]|jgi:hypothetical protein